MKAKALILLLSAAVIQVTESLPTGAPISACDNITPEPGHGGAPQSPNTIPYFVDITQFGNDPTPYYLSDTVYNGKNWLTSYLCTVHYI